MNFRLNGIVKKTSLTVLVFVAFLFSFNRSMAQSDVIDVKTFENIVVSPHIAVVFEEGEQESVRIESITVPIEKLNVVVKNKTLSVFLDDAKITQPTKKEYINGYKRKVSVYSGTVVKAIITYKTLNSIDLRGEERFNFVSNLNTEKLHLKIYGESQVFLNEVSIQNLKVTLYGENYLEIRKGKIENQKVTAYGESEVNSLKIDNSETILTSYGEGVFKFNISEKLNITSFGEASIDYTGNPDLDKGIIIGETEITRVD